MLPESPRNVYSVRMGHDRRISVRTAADRAAETERALAAMRAEFPGRDFLEVFGGWMAVPEGTPVVFGVDLDSVAEKLRDRSTELY